MSGTTVKFTVAKALFLTTFLTALPAKNLPPTFPYGNKAANYKLLANDVFTQDDCPFKDAKESTVLSWLKNIFSGVDTLHNHISDIEATGQALNMEELRNNIMLAGGGGTCTTLELVSAELDAQKLLGLVYPTPAAKSILAIQACSIKNTLRCY
ncbi:hypothetical protein B484DRAFT_409562 [Ochromonadaceae sp. CCMP2298]|nr:hypothetical protein B484DRAFT_409562 [Ochromonadaceae sp. CCMP2298]